jgi:hypothetical protein
MVEWLEDGPSDVPIAALEAAVDFARAHPRRLRSARGLWRVVMTRLHLTEVTPRPSGGRFSFALGPTVTAVVAVAALVGAGLWLGGGFTTPGGDVNPTATPTLSPTPSPTPTPTPPIETTRPTAGPTAWVLPPGWASGSQVCRMRPGATSATVDGVLETRGTIYDCTTTSEDPRLSGTAVVTSSSDEFEDGTWLGWGTQETTNADGSWSGAFAVTSTATAPSMAFDSVALGSGGYAGLEVLYHVVMHGSGAITVDGIVRPVGTEVAGTETCSATGAGHDLAVGEIVATRGLEMSCTDTMSDERLSGARSLHVSVDTRADDSADLWGTSIVTNDGGTWEGFFFGTVDPGYTTHHVRSLMYGTGEYEGLLFRLEVVGTGDPGFDLRGEIIDPR